MHQSRGGRRSDHEEEEEASDGVLQRMDGNHDRARLDQSFAAPGEEGDGHDQKRPPDDEAPPRGLEAMGDGQSAALVSTAGPALNPRGRTSTIGSRIKVSKTGDATMRRKSRSGSRSMLA